MIGIEKCRCGKCSDYWLTGIGTFCQGSGFTEQEATLIAQLLNEYAAQKGTADGKG